MPVPEECKNMKSGGVEDEAEWIDDPKFDSLKTIIEGLLARGRSLEERVEDLERRCPIKPAPVTQEDLRKAYMKS